MRPNISLISLISLISAKIEGYVDAVRAGENQSVHAGDILVEIDPTDYPARVAAAQAALAPAQGSQRAGQSGRALVFGGRGALSAAGGTRLALARAHAAATPRGWTARRCRRPSTTLLLLAIVIGGVAMLLLRPRPKVGTGRAKLDDAALAH